MAARLGAVVAVLLAGVLGLPGVASAQEVAIVGIVVRMDAGPDTLWIQEYTSTGTGRVWTVRVTDIARSGIGPSLGMQVGDVVEVRGVVIGANALLASAIAVRARGAVPGIGGPGIGPAPGIGGQGQRIEIDGIIVDMHQYRQGFLRIQDRERDRGGLIWTVRLTALTKIEGRRDGRSWDDDDGTGIAAAGRLLQVGDRVKVEGRLIAGGQILAEEIEVRGRARGLPRPPVPQPTPYPPVVWQTVILSPQPGTEVAGSEFTVVGRTIPGARVQVHVQARWGVFQMQVANTSVTADQYGIFIVTVRPSMRISGAVYTITATSTYQGVTMTPVTVTVRQN